MSDTPRTDAAIWVEPIAGGNHQVVLASVARTLERELAERDRLLRKFVEDVMPTMRALKCHLTMGLEDFEESAKALLPETHHARGDGQHPLAHLGEPYDCTRCGHLGGCPTPVKWPGCYSAPVKTEQKREGAARG